MSPTDLNTDLAAARERIAQLESELAESRSKIARYEWILKHTTSEIVLSKPDGTRTYYNAPNEDNIGYSLEELNTNDSRENVHPDDRPKLQAAFADMMAHTLDKITMEYRWQHKNGQWRYRKTTAYNFLDVPGIDAIMTDSQDITTLRESEIRQREMLEAIPVMITVSRLPDGKIVYANKHSAKIFGVPASQLIGKSTIAVYHNPEQDRPILLTALKEKGSLENYELLLKRIVDDTPFWASMTVQMSTYQGEPAVLAAYIDITARREMEAERALLQQEIIEAQQRMLKELSVPIIPITDQILAMPLIGSLDSLRARDITRGLLTGINQYRAKVAIIDVTGVPVIDSGVAGYLNKTIQAARLKGVRIIVTGISNAVAEAIVDIGIDWSAIETHRDLQSGLRAAMKQLKNG